MGTKPPGWWDTIDLNRLVIAYSFMLQHVVCVSRCCKNKLRISIILRTDQFEWLVCTPAYLNLQTLDIIDSVITDMQTFSVEG